ncbi:decapping endonuclease targeting mRNA, partial [Coemansia helicoidea]
MGDGHESGRKHTIRDPGASDLTDSHSTTNGAKKARGGDNCAEMSRPVARLSVHPLSKYRTRCPAFSQPREIVSFSYDHERRQVMDDRELKYYAAPSLDPAPCLFDGFERQVQRDGAKNEHIDGLLGALAHLRAQGDARAARDAQADFVMYRGMLTQLFVTPYSARDAWSMNATRVGPTIYIEENVTAEKIADRAGADENHRRM